MLDSWNPERLIHFFRNSPASAILKKLDKDIAHLPTRPLSNEERPHFTALRDVYRIAQLRGRTEIQFKAYMILVEFEKYTTVFTEEQKRKMDRDVADLRDMCTGRKDILRFAKAAGLIK